MDLVTDPDLGERLSKVTARRDSLDTNLEAAQMALDEKYREMEELRARNEELELTFTGLSRRNEELSDDLAEKEAEVDNLDAQISDLKDALQKDQENDVDQGLKEHSDNLIKSELEMEVAELQARLQATEQELAAAQDGARRQEMARRGREAAQYAWSVAIIDRKVSECVRIILRLKGPTRPDAANSASIRYSSWSRIVCGVGQERSHPRRSSNSSSHLCKRKHSRND